MPASLDLPTLLPEVLDPQMHVQQENNNATVADEVDPELLAKVLANPEMRALLNSLAKTMK